MAIINEINGDLDGHSWAQKGYENYGNCLSLRYVNIRKQEPARTS
jgi:hypothetical protein